MTDDADELERIRDRKRQQLLEREADESATAPDEPVHPDGREEFERAVADHDVVLADFYADWCGPCQMLSPVIEAVARKTSAAVVKVDTDRNAALAREYGVQGLPTLVLFADGQPVERLVGVQDEGTLTDLIETHAP